jgi:Na+/H+-dicarboxylate symporter
MVLGLFIGANTTTVYTGVDSVANAFVMLLQMTALPYIALSLIIGIGSLSAEQVRNGFKQSFIILLAMVLLVLLYILLAPIAFPNWISADFYSLNTIKTSKDLDLISLFIPRNPFHSFANGLIPSVVLFSIFVGIGLMGAKGKKQTLLALTGLNNAIINISNIVMKLAPIGIFCIALRAAATINPSQIDGLLVYIVTASVLVFLLSFLILPAIVSTITILTYRQVLKTSREAMITAFATGSFFIVIPLIVEKTKQLINDVYEKQASLNKSTTKPGIADALKIPSIIVPITFSLPVGGKLLALLFVLFAAWFSGAQVEVDQYIKLLAMGLPQLFGTSTVAMPNLLEIFNVQSSFFELFLVAENLIVGRLNALLSVIFSTCFVLLVVASVTKQFTFKWKSFVRYLILLPLFSIATFYSLRVTFDAISYQYQGYEKFIERDFVLVDVDATVLREPEEANTKLYPYVDVLHRVKQRGFIRVGYFRDDLPYAFHNNDGKLVGFDIEIINLLADDLDIGIEFVRIYHKQAKALLSSGYLDMTTGIPVLPNNMTELTLTIPYTSQAIAFIIKDEKRREFTDWKNIFKRDDLIIGIPELFYSENLIKRYFKNGKVWEISTPRLFFKEDFEHIDAMLFGAPTASAWTLLHPDYTVIVPKPAQPPLYMAFAINNEDNAFELFMRNWITTKTKNNDIDRLFDYWVAGNKPLLLSEKLTELKPHAQD